jgi:hypothetical protein
LIGRSRLAPAFVLGGCRGGRPDRARRARQGPLTAILLLGVAGIGRSFLRRDRPTLLQRTVDDDVLARVFGVQEGLSWRRSLWGSADRADLSS